MVESQLHHIVKAIHQPYINPIHQSNQSRLFSRFRITCTIKPNKKTNDQSIYTQLFSLKKNQKCINITSVMTFLVTARYNL